MTTRKRLPASGLSEDILAEIGEQEERQEHHLVTFALGESYGVPIRQVQEIVRVGNVTMVPNAPDYMEGVINLRGKVLPVLNLRKRLKLPEQPITSDSRIIITEIGDKVVGLLVDAVTQVVKVPGDLCEDAPEEVLEVDTDYLTGVCKLGERLVIMLDLERLLRRDKLDAGEVQHAGNGAA